MTKDQEALISKARDSLRAAKLLESNGLIDFAASRAYYTMFYVASALLLGKGLSFSKHGSLLAAFGQHLVKTGEIDARLHRYLIDAEDNRITGDYSTQSSLTQPEIASMISQAEEFIALADRMLGPTPTANDPSPSDPS
ncbi:MAG: HEPN domain-containing protein [Blastocatellia bacterium]